MIGHSLRARSDAEVVTDRPARHPPWALIQLCQALAASPAGFEAAHTAPEAAIYRIECVFCAYTYAPSGEPPERLEPSVARIGHY